MAIYVITHKYLDDLSMLPQGHQPLFVGAYRLTERKEGYLYDDVGEHISEKNQSWCELTGMYWMLHNCNDSIKGLVHYRRFFSKRELSIDSKHFYSEEELARLLETTDCIVAQKTYFPFSIRKHYEGRHNADDYRILEEVIREKYPEYIESFKKASNARYAYCFNMIVAKREVFDTFAIWLLQVLSAVEDRLQLDDRDHYQKRVIGFLAERLLNVWLIHNQIRFKELPVVQTDGSKKYMLRRKMERILGIFLHPTGYKKVLRYRRQRYEK